MNVHANAHMSHYSSNAARNIMESKMSVICIDAVWLESVCQECTVPQTYDRGAVQYPRHTIHSNLAKSRSSIISTSVKLIGFKFCTDHGSITSVLCVKFRNE